MTNLDRKKSAMVQPSTFPTDPFAVAYLQLCQVSYAADPSTIPAQVQQLPPLDQGGSWQCIWGPAQTADESNLVFVAQYTMAAGLPPVFAAVVARGTDFDITDGWGIVEQIWEDLDVTSQVPLPWAPDSPARIAGGTASTLTDIQGLTSGGQTLLQFLTAYLAAPANQNPILVATGHSLGGCMMSVIAPWLQNALSVLHLVPATFAAPTAGNADFASYFASTFGYSLRVFNTLDVVPDAWANLDVIPDIYVPCGFSATTLVDTAVLGFEAAMDLARVSYAQPATNQVPLKGACETDPAAANWYDEAFYQHHSTTYMTLLGGQSVIPPQTAVSHHPASRR